MKYVIGLVILSSAIFGYRMLVSEDLKVSEVEVSKTEITEDLPPVTPIVSKPVATPVAMPAPKKPAAPVAEPVQAPTSIPAPEVVKANHSGQWSGRFTTEKPDECANYSGDWTLKIIDTDGVLTGRWTSTDGTEGDIKGSSKESRIDFKGLYGDYVLIEVGFDVIGKDVINGKFSRTQECTVGTGPVLGRLTGTKNY